MSSKAQLLHGNALQALRKVDTESIDSLVTDPPSGISLLNLEWDDDLGGRDRWIRWLADIMYECKRTLKPGAHGVVWALPRTSHWTTMALEDAGFIIKDVITHVFGTGFPKGMNVDKMIDRARYTDTGDVYRVTEWIRSRRDALGLTNRDLDKAAGIEGGASHWTAKPPNGKPAIPTKERWEKLKTLLGDAPPWFESLLKPSYELGSSWEDRKVLGQYKHGGWSLPGSESENKGRQFTKAQNLNSKKWAGWGTALKPGVEHWILVQKPISEHNLAANILKFGTGAINIDGCRIPTTDKIGSRTNLDFKESAYLGKGKERAQDSVYHQNPSGRYPANLILTRSQNGSDPPQILDHMAFQENPKGVSRFFKTFDPPFFYCPKASRKEKGQDNFHPTVKPLKLMEYLCRLVTPPQGTVIDPFMGSGSTGVAALNEGFSFVGVEKDGKYFSIAEKRINSHLQMPQAETA